MSHKKKLGLYGLRMHMYLTREARYNMCGIMELWVTVKVVTLILAWFGYFIFTRRKIGFYLFGKEVISCLNCANLRAFHENPHRIYTELTFINS